MDAVRAAHPQTPDRFDDAVAAPLLAQIEGLRQRYRDARAAYDVGERGGWDGGPNTGRLYALDAVVPGMTPVEQAACHGLYAMVGVGVICRVAEKTWFAYRGPESGTVFAASEGITRLDLYQESWPIFLKALLGWDPDRSALSTYCHMEARSSYQTALVSESRREDAYSESLYVVGDDGVEHERPIAGDVAAPEVDHHALAAAVAAADDDPRLEALVQALFGPDGPLASPRRPA